MKKMRVLLATACTAVFLGAFAAPAQASHHCAPPPFSDEYGVSDAVWVVCEYGYHDPVGVAKYIICWLSPSC